MVKSVNKMSNYKDLLSAAVGVEPFYGRGDCNYIKPNIEVEIFYNIGIDGFD
jgi:hypothetical protein